MRRSRCAAALGTDAVPRPGPALLVPSDIADDSSTTVAAGTCRVERDVGGGGVGRHQCCVVCCAITAASPPGHSLRSWVILTVPASPSTASSSSTASPSTAARPSRADTTPLRRSSRTSSPGSSELPQSAGRAAGGEGGVLFCAMCVGYCPRDNATTLQRHCNNDTAPRPTHTRSARVLTPNSYPQPQPQQVYVQQQPQKGGAGAGTGCLACCAGSEYRVCAGVGVRAARTRLQRRRLTPPVLCCCCAEELCCDLCL